MAHGAVALHRSSVSCRAAGKMPRIDQQAARSRHRRSACVRASSHGAFGRRSTIHPCPLPTMARRACSSGSRRMSSSNASAGGDDAQSTGFAPRPFRKRGQLQSAWFASRCATDFPYGWQYGWPYRDHSLILMFFATDVQCDGEIRDFNIDRDESNS